MNLRTIKSNVARWLRPTDKTETTRKIANRLYRNRAITQRNGDADGDWKTAERIRKNAVWRLLFWLNQPCIWTEKQVVEPVAHWVDRADLFRIIARLSPTLEALGVIAIPLVLFLASQRYQENLQQRELEKLQQQTVTSYLNQLSTILLEVEGDLRDPQNQELRTLTTATTLTLLRDPNLNSPRKGQVIKFLAQMGLVTRKIVYGPQQPESQVVTISLKGADLGYADLGFADLNFADFSFANLVGANLRSSNLIGVTLVGTNLDFANLNFAKLSGATLVGTNLDFAKLHGTNLVSANMVGADLASANLMAANLAGANLVEANLYNTDLTRADLSFAKLDRANLGFAALYGADNLTESQVQVAYLCETQLPQDIRLDPNRDCETLKLLYPSYFDKS
ncbi:MAG: pentapeptide repeat-containing protein [Cyanobacteria bacterium P01_H01_bin.105]